MKKTFIFSFLLFFLIPVLAWDAMDSSCFYNCTSRGLGGGPYCLQACSYDDYQPSYRPSVPAPDFSAPFQGFIRGLEEGRRARQQEELIRLEQERLRREEQSDYDLLRLPSYLKQSNKEVPPPPPPPSILYTYDENGDWRGFQVWDEDSGKYLPIELTAKEKEEYRKSMSAELNLLVILLNRANKTEVNNPPYLLHVLLKRANKNSELPKKDIFDRLEYVPDQNPPPK